MLQKPRNLNWFEKSTSWIILTILGSYISSAAGALTGFLYSEYQKRNNVLFYVLGEETGEARPRQLFRLAQEDGWMMEFDPPILEQVRVCEYKLSHGQSWPDLALDYLEHYNDCFFVRRRGPKSLVVAPNELPNTRLSRSSSGEYACRCAKMSKMFNNEEQKILQENSLYN